MIATLVTKEVSVKPSMVKVIEAGQNLVDNNNRVISSLLEFISSEYGEASDIHDAVTNLINGNNEYYKQIVLAIQNNEFI